MIQSPFPPIPKDTAKAANAVFGRRNFYIETGRRANDLFSGIDLMSIQGWLKKSVHTVAQLFLITIFQFRETLPDEQAEAALQERLDWKHALHLPLQEPGLEAALLCEFRQWLLIEQSERHHLGVILSRIGGAGAIQEYGGLQEEDLLRHICLISRLNKIWCTVRDVLETLALQQPEWLRQIILPEWYLRYGDHSQGPELTASGQQLEDLAQVIGADGCYLLDRIAQSGLPDLQALPRVQTLSQVWSDQFEFRAGEVTWRRDSCAGCALANPQKFLPRRKK